MARKKPPPPPVPAAGSSAPVPVFPVGDPLARALAQHIRDAHGVDQAVTLDLAEEIGSPRAYVGTRNLALDRALDSLGIPLGRITEISGWPGAGKSTMADQILAEVQAAGGLAVLADTERTRNKPYMVSLGVDLASCVWIGGRTIETMFEEVETLAKTVAHYNVVAWHEAMAREGLRPPALGMYRHQVFDPADTSKKRKPVADFAFAQWTRGHSAVLMDYQREQKLPVTGVRDNATRDKLRPFVVLAPPEQKEAIAASYLAGELTGDAARWVQPADRPVVIVWDSVAGTPSEQELDGDARDVHPATAAKVLRRNLRRLTQLLADEAIGLVVVNQLYEKIDIGPVRSRGPKAKTYGGGAIEYHTVIRVQVDKVDDIYKPGEGEDSGSPPMGQVVEIKVQKNKVGSPFTTERFALIFGRGCDNAWAIYTDLVTRGVIHKGGGGWSRFTDSALGDKSFQGWTGLSNLMAEDPGLFTTLKEIYLEGRA